MAVELTEEFSDKLHQWIESSLATGSHTLAAGYQGQTLIYRDHACALVIKVPHGRGVVRWIHTRMLRHEYSVYKKLKNYAFAPACLGMIRKHYLVLEFIDGHSFRQQRPQDEAQFFSLMLQAIQDLHHLGIAHMDLKKKDNFLVVQGATPCLIDFGAAVVRQSGWHPFNAFRYQLGVRFDFNAWIKHKYRGNISAISAEDLPYYHKTMTEMLARRIKWIYRKKIKAWYRKMSNKK